MVFKYGRIVSSNINWQIVQKFLIYLNKKLKETNKYAEIHWYDSNYVFGYGSYDNQLDTSNARMYQNEEEIVSDGFLLIMVGILIY